MRKKKFENFPVFANVYVIKRASLMSFCFIKNIYNLNFVEQNFIEIYLGEQELATGMVFWQLLTLSSKTFFVT